MILSHFGGQVTASYLTLFVWLYGVFQMYLYIFFVNFEPDNFWRSNASRRTHHRVHGSHVQQPQQVCGRVQVHVDDVNERWQLEVVVRWLRIDLVHFGHRRHRKYVRFYDGPSGCWNPERTQRERDAGPETRGYQYHASFRGNLEPTVNDVSWTVRVRPHHTRTHYMMVVSSLRVALPDDQRCQQHQQTAEWFDENGGAHLRWKSARRVVPMQRNYCATASVRAGWIILDFRDTPKTRSENKWKKD